MDISYSKMWELLIEKNEQGRYVLYRRHRSQYADQTLPDEEVSTAMLIKSAISKCI